MIYEIWIEEFGETEEITLKKENKSKEKYNISENASLHKSFVANSYEEAKKEMHKIMGWEEYIPFS